MAVIHNEKYFFNSNVLKAEKNEKKRENNKENKCREAKGKERERERDRYTSNRHKKHRLEFLCNVVVLSDKILLVRLSVKKRERKKIGK